MTPGKKTFFKVELICVLKEKFFGHIRILKIQKYKKYLSHVPTCTSENAFYLRALLEPNGQIWYYKKAAGRKTLGNVVKNIMKKARFKGYFTNHSLRRSCATRLYDAGIPEQVIQETTGH